MIFCEGYRGQREVFVFFNIWIIDVSINDVKDRVYSMLIKFVDVINLEVVVYIRRLRISINGFNEIINTGRKEENQILFRKV